MTLGQEYRPLRDLVGDWLRKAIISGKYPPGTHLVEDRIAQELDVSRNPVREAFRVLESEGFIRRAPRKAAVVAMLSDDEVQEIFEARMGLEGLAAELAARKAGPSSTEPLWSILDQTEKALEEGDQAAVVDLNTRFHESMLELSGNGFLRNLMVQLRGRTEWVFSQTVRGYRGHESLQEHRELAAVIERGDVEQASTLARAHVDAAAKTYWEAVSEQQAQQETS